MARNQAISDCNDAMLTAYYSALNGNLSGVNIYDSYVPDDEENLNQDFKYVLLSTTTSLSDNDKTQQGWDFTLLIDVVTGFRNNARRKELDAICEDIMPLIYPASGSYLSPTGFKVITTEIIGNEDLIEETDNFIAFRRLIRVRHLIRQQ